MTADDLARYRDRVTQLWPPDLIAWLHRSHVELGR
ncbi:hypothetical protein O979_16430 [Mycobacterium avium subsp. paratuberculosis 10-4404]|nr:hypothetical protein D522_05213 [Mycobacterium avium subsp. paratuberculosis S5]ETA99795.1 hypothetical protein O979_16430 [Mycobacterium avium subsp. paratuberculosis 10-4404]ETB02238.1 hypothetical protein O978_16330 [Mycobacterium avium subsp. paratuberculosis 10-5864]ETB10320.1 hypothetical protein O980_15960 [Mycobacterium avium subsp. paratuberculosis 08-8281]ETB28384.1 hypothetical protein O977_20350 [Mycobacterium avium subsp. paratuberculosis 10-5975]ETB37282.1 hypothetical protein